jgi:Gpi18-like mannosyltransferase
MTSSCEVDEKLEGGGIPRGVSIGWLVALVVCVTATLSEGYGGDIAAMTRWMTELQSGGFSRVRSNYPPFLLNWLWLGGQIFDGLYVGTPSMNLVKSWIMLLVWWAWMLLIYQVGSSLISTGIKPRESWVFWLTVLNPAIIAGGPQWGQVDLLPWIFISLGLLAHQQGRHMFSPALFALAVTVKFQAIVYGPIFAGLYIRAVVKDRKLIWAIPCAVLSILLCFLPFLISGMALAQAQGAYWSNIGIMPSASNNAANLWRLIGVEAIPSSVPLLNRSGFEWLTPTSVGLSLFCLSSLLVFFLAVIKRSDVWLLALAINFSFFAFCPEMHERYLLAAVPAAAMWASRNRSRSVWYAFTTALAALNISLVFFPRNQHEWRIVSFLVVLGAFALIFEALGARSRFRIFSWLDRRPRLVLTFACLSPLLLVLAQARAESLSKLFRLGIGESLLLASLSPASVSQSWGSGPLYQTPGMREEYGFSDTRISSGIKVHAWSEIRYRLPLGRYQLGGKCGPEKIANVRSSMRFMIKSNDETVWQSEISSGPSGSAPFSLILVGPSELSFVVDPLDTNFGDHALWGDVVLSRLE